MANELSGPQWVSRFPGSTSTSTLTAAFRMAVDAFIRAMRAGGATVSIAATLRPLERAYLMHWSWRIADALVAPEAVPAKAGVSIDWVHRDGAGNVDIVASRQAARAMVNGYALRKQPSLTSRHEEGRAIDMTISWNGTLNIQRPDQTVASITSTPRSGLNAELQRVGALYGVRKLQNDPPHWSDDGA